MSIEYHGKSKKKKNISRGKLEKILGKIREFRVYILEDTLNMLDTMISSSVIKEVFFGYRILSPHGNSTCRAYMRASREGRIGYILCRHKIKSLRTDYLLTKCSIKF